MKLSKRIKHVRRGRHTKRTGKHHTRRIKHRSKQYKRTYRKNSRKLKNNKRIQRGGAPIPRSPEVTWDKTNNTTSYLLRYKKKGAIANESKMFKITFEFIQNKKGIGLNYTELPEPYTKTKLPNGINQFLSIYFYGTFKVTMTRESDSKVFVVYFAVYGIERSAPKYDSNTTKRVIHPVVVYSSYEDFSDEPRKMIDKLERYHCDGLSGVTDDTGKQSYDFYCGNTGGYNYQDFARNRTFFDSLIKEMFNLGKKKYDAAKKAKADEAKANANAPAPPPPASGHNAVTSTLPAPAPPPTHADADASAMDHAPAPAYTTATNTTATEASDPNADTTAANAATDSDDTAANANTGSRGAELEMQKLEPNADADDNNAEKDS
jgi:hypothetical protein